MRNFFFNLAHLLEPVEDRVALASLARDLGHHHIALRIAKISARRGAELPQFSYPTDILPEFDKPGRQVEQALIHALIRQESEFNPAAISHAGARGLMQLMPATAKGVARLHGARYHRPHLTQRPQYNLMLGTAHVGDLIHAFGGSYIMTIAAYNAGPGRIPQWTKRYGDPRQGEIEAVDFIESIPFNETRNYVKRVLENLQVYRSLFGVTPPIPISIDMHRGGEMPEEIAEMNSCEAEADPSIEQMIACN